MLPIYQTINKVLANTSLDRTNSPACVFVAPMLDVCVFLLIEQHLLSGTALHGSIPIQVLTAGSTNDISPLLQFRWYMV